MSKSLKTKKWNCLHLFFSNKTEKWMGAQIKIFNFKEGKMPRFIIEREMPEAGKLTRTEMKDISKQSNDIIKELGPDIQWEESFVTNDKLYCVYLARNEDLIKEHAKRGDFPIHSIKRVNAVLDPIAAE